jgi:hypothetical protein
MPGKWVKTGWGERGSTPQYHKIVRKGDSKKRNQRHRVVEVLCNDCHGTFEMRVDRLTQTREHTDYRLQSCIGNHLRRHGAGLDTQVDGEVEGIQLGKLGDRFAFFLGLNLDQSGLLDDQVAVEAGRVATVDVARFVRRNASCYVFRVAKSVRRYLLYFDPPIFVDQNMALLMRESFLYACVDHAWPACLLTPDSAASVDAWRDAVLGCANIDALFVQA